MDTEVRRGGGLCVGRVIMRNTETDRRRSGEGQGRRGKGVEGTD